MSKHLLNLALHFALEILALIGMGYWGWVMHEGILGLVMMIGVPLFAAAIWGIFRVNGDPKKAPVEIRGWMRLLLEVAFFGSAVLLLFFAKQSTIAIIFALVVVVHYTTTYDRILWLLRER